MECGISPKYGGHMALQYFGGKGIVSWSKGALWVAPPLPPHVCIAIQDELKTIPVNSSLLSLRGKDGLMGVSENVMLG